jgi:hypothetical protein
MIGKIFITRTGYDPQLGKHIKDPYLGPRPTLGACRPDIRRRLREGDHLFVISGKVPGIEQFVMGGFEIESKMNAMEAYQLFPELRLRQRSDGQLTGNIIVDGDGRQHPLDDHNSFDKRIKNYVIGKNVLALETDPEIAAGRRDTMEILQDILRKKGKSPVNLVTRFGTDLNEQQIMRLRDWLDQIKRGSN